MDDPKTLNVPSDVETTAGRPVRDSATYNPSASDPPSDIEKSPARADPSAAPPSNGAPFPPLREAIFLAVVCSTQLLMQAAFGGVLLPAHLIGAQLNATSLGELSWFLAGYSLTVGTCILFAGRLGDRYGHRRAVIAGWLWFALWSLIAGLAAVPQSAVMFAVCRALQGIGPALCLPNALAILGRTYLPGRRKGMAFAALGACAPGGATLGALVNSALAEYSWWPIGFWMNAGMCLMLAFLAWAVIPADKLAPMAERPGLDLRGAALGVVGLVLVNVAWNEAPIVGWQAPYVIVILILGLLLLGGFAWAERSAAHPLLPPGCVDWAAARVWSGVGLGWASCGVWAGYTVQLLEELRGVSALMASVQFIPVSVTGGCAALVTGVLLSHWHSSWLMVASMFAFTVGSLLSATAPVEQIYWANIFVGMVITPWG